MEDLLRIAPLLRLLAERVREAGAEVDSPGSRAKKAALGGGAYHRGGPEEMREGVLREAQ